MLDQLLSVFIPSAYAADAQAAAPQGGGFSLILMLGLFFVFAYFMVWRPQAKRAKQQQQLLQSIAKGDEVVTIGGLIGTVVKVTDAYVHLNLASSIDVVLQKSAVASILPKGTLKTL